MPSSTLFTPAVPAFEAKPPTPSPALASEPPTPFDSEPPVPAPDVVCAPAVDSLALPSETPPPDCSSELAAPALPPAAVSISPNVLSCPSLQATSESSDTIPKPNEP